MRASNLLALACSGALLVSTGIAGANGRFPSAGQILVDPVNPDHVVVRATYGLLSSSDRGQSWGWICESAMGYGGLEDPMLGLTAGGGLLAGTFEGLAVSHDAGCSWSFAGGALGGASVIDLSVQAGDPERAIVLVTPPSGEKGDRVLRTSDGAQTFIALGAALPADFLALTLDAAPQAPSTIYISGRFGLPDYQAALLRSTDDGKTWTPLDLPGIQDRLPYIAAIAPADPATVYVRVDDTPGDTLLVTHDGGATWAEIFKSQGDLLAFALSPDGTEILAGGNQDGLWKAPASAPVFAKVSSLSAHCATWTKDGLYACAEELADGFVVGLSKDGGQTMEPLMHLYNPCGPLACSPVEIQCAGEWPALAMRLGAKSCAPDAGITAASRSGGTSSSPSSAGCGCHLGPAPESPPCLLGAALALLVIRRRRYRGGGAGSSSSSSPKRTPT